MLVMESICHSMNINLLEFTFLLGVTKVYDVNFAITLQRILLYRYSNWHYTEDGKRESIFQNFASSQMVIKECKCSKCYAIGKIINIKNSLCNKT